MTGAGVKGLEVEPSGLRVKVEKDGVEEVLGLR